MVVGVGMAQDVMGWSFVVVDRYVVSVLFGDII